MRKGVDRKTPITRRNSICADVYAVYTVIFTGKRVKNEKSICTQEKRAQPEKADNNTWRRSGSAKRAIIERRSSVV